MIQELVEYGKQVMGGKSKAFCEESFTIELAIDKEGVFQGLNIVNEKTIETALVTEHDPKKGPVGIIRAKQGHARFLLDKSEEVLGVGDDAEKKHKIFMTVLERYQGVDAMKPVFAFYSKKEELSKAVAAFYKLKKAEQKGNITFMVGTELLLRNENIKNAIIHFYEEDIKRLKNGRKCSVCGTSDSPVLDEPHGLVRMPMGQKAGSALVSFNASVFESYGLKGNLNSSICRNCARNYNEGLKSLLSGELVGEGDKKHNKYDHRVNISKNTVALFWTQQETEYNPLIVTNPPQPSDIVELFESIWSGESKVGEVTDTNMFYSCTLTSAAARISVRDWTAISLSEYKKNIADWFKDIEIYDKNGEPAYSAFSRLVNATIKASSQKTGDPDTKSRTGSLLWNAAIKGRQYKIPIKVMMSVLNRIWVGDSFSVGKAAVIKMVINRNTERKMESKLDEANTSVAYLCGRLFAVIEEMQRVAIGKVNSGVKERFFAAAAAQPACIFGTLLTKNVPIYQHKIKGYLMGDLESIVKPISESGTFPQRFTPIEQGEFALGYYFQKNTLWQRFVAKQKKVKEETNE